MEAKKCTKCGALSSKVAGFCEGCGKKFPGAANSDLVVMFFILIIVLIACAFGYSKGYRMSSNPAAQQAQPAQQPSPASNTGNTQAPASSY